MLEIKGKGVSVMAPQFQFRVTRKIVTIIGDSRISRWMHLPIFGDRETALIRNSCQALLGRL